MILGTNTQGDGKVLVMLVCFLCSSFVHPLYRLTVGLRLSGQPFVQTQSAFRTNPANAAFRPFGFYLYKEVNPSAHPFLSSGVVANNYNHPLTVSVW
jgi:hypothetical protein